MTELSKRLEAVRARQRVRSDFVWDRVAQNVVAVIDCGMGGASVTNDADNVIAFLLAAEHLNPADRLIYRDSEGMWDEIVYWRGPRAVFRSLRAANIKEALDKLP